MIKNENPESNYLNWQTAKIVPVKTMFVHAARVWKAIIKDDIVVTIGEVRIKHVYKIIIHFF